MEEAWTLRGYLRDADDEPLGGPAVSVRIEELVKLADGVAPMTARGPIRFTRRERGAIAWTLLRWLDDVSTTAFPEQAMELRYALHAADLG